MTDTARILYFGTPAFGVPPLEALINDPLFEVRAVVTQPDRPSGRGQKLSPSPVKEAALKHSIPVLQPQSLKGLQLSNGQLTGEKSSASLAGFASDIDGIVVVAYGKIIPKCLLEYTPCGVINIHPSLLPRWRGAAPIQRSLFTGDKVTGISLMRLEEGLDTGPVFSQIETEILPSDTLGTLSDRLAQQSAQLLVEELPAILDGRLKPQPQGEEGVTYAEKWEKSDCEIQWTESAEVSWRRVRTCAPLIGAKTNFKKQLLKVFSAEMVNHFPEGKPGEVVEVNRAELVIACGEKSFLSLLELQLPGKTRLPVEEFLKGVHIKIGDRLGE